MALYSLESKSSVARLSGHSIVPDSSYVISLIRSGDQFNKVCLAFHWDALNAGATFCINVTVQYELLRNIRRGYLKTVLSSLLASDPSLRDRFNRCGDPENILKDYIKEGDFNDILSKMTVDCWAEVKKWLKDLELEYYQGSWSGSWDDLGTLVNESCLEAADAMIANFARGIGAAAIVTADYGFALVKSPPDIYMPRNLASKCKTLYDPALDK